ncbi:MAG: S8 family peptidase, partial [Candidatus Kariarchaeaceae archaeon]
MVREGILSIILMITLIIFSIHLYGNESINHDELMLKGMPEAPSNEIQDGLEEISNQQVVSFYANQEEYERAIQHLQQWKIERYPNLLAIKLTPKEQLTQEDQQYLYNIQSTRVYDQSFQLHSLPKEGEITVNSILSQVDQLQLNALDQDNFHGAGVRIGIIDTGVDFSVPILSHLNYTQRDFNLEHPPATDWHGTQVASALAGWDPSTNTRYGAATESYIVSAGMGGIGNSIDGDFLGAFEYLIEEEVDIINTSFSGEPEIWSKIVERLFELNITLVGSMGNSGTEGEGNNPFSGQGPGTHRYAIAVGGITETMDLFDQTSEGPTHNQISKPDFVAQGKDVHVAKYGSTSIITNSGTSFASPLFAGGLASLISALKHHNIDYSPGSLKSQLIDHAQKPPTLTHEYTIGNGMANFSATYEDYVSNGSSSINITPNSAIPYGFQAEHLRGAKQPLKAWMMTAVDPSSLQMEFEGNISILLRKNGDITRQQQFIPVQIESDKTIPFGNYSGKITLYSLQTLRNDSLQVQISIKRDLVANVLFDLKYTDMDLNTLIEGTVNDYAIMNRMFGERTGSAIKFLWQQGYYIQESNEHLSSKILENVDILWLDDLLPVTVWDVPFVGYDPGVWNTTIQDTIVNFVKSGGSVFADFRGYVKNGDQYSYLSND